MNMNGGLYDRARKVLESPNASPDSLARGVAVLAGSGLSKPAIARWMRQRISEYGIPLDAATDEFSRVLERGIGLARQGDTLRPSPAEVDAAKAPAREPEIPPVPTLPDVGMPAAAQFKDAEHLVAVALDARGTHLRIKQLKGAVAEAHEALGKVAAEKRKLAEYDAKVRAAHDAEQEKIKGQWNLIKAERTRLDERERALASDLELAQKWKNFENAQKYEHVGPRDGGLVREYCDR
jgi:hypothetical protein